MAVAIIGGLVVSTTLSLLVVPAFLRVADSAKTKVGEMFGRGGDEDQNIEEAEPAST